MRGEEVFLYYLEGMLKFWEENRQIINQSHITSTLKGIFKEETGKNWNILPLVDVTGSGIEISKWVGRWMEILVENYGIIEG